MLGQLWARKGRKSRTNRTLAAAIEPLERRQLLSQSVELFGSTPALFVENQGQWAEEEIRYAAATRGANVGLTDTGLSFQLLYQDPADPSEEPATQLAEFSARFLNANPVTPSARQQPASRFNYFLGEQSNWRSEVPGYEQVVYEDLYPGIDLHVQPQRQFLKYEFHVSPGSDFSPIALRYEGLTALALSNSGDLLLTTPAGILTDKAPLIWQEIDGQRMDVAGEYVLLDEQTFGFRITGEVDERHELIIDPELVWSTSLGGTSPDVGFGVAVDNAGTAYLSGFTSSAGWVSGGWDTNHGGGFDAFVAKRSSDGQHVWSTYLGGTGTDRAIGIAVDMTGGVYVTGDSASYGWVSGGFDVTPAPADGDAFLAKLDSSSGNHVWSTYLGWPSGADGWGVAVDASDDVYATGQLSQAGSGYAYVVKVDSAGSHVWSTSLPGASTGLGIACDGSGSVYLTGHTRSAGWASGGFDLSYGGGDDAFVAKISSADGQHLWSTYLGGAGDEHGQGIAVDSSGEVFVTGQTGSAGWISGGFDTSLSGATDAFVLKLNSAGQHLWSTYIGGSAGEYAWGDVVASDAVGGVYVTGSTSSSGWVSGGFDDSYGGTTDAFVLRLSTSGEHLWSSYMGVSGSGYAVAANGPYAVCVAGTSGSDAFVARVSDAPDTQAPALASGITAVAGDGQVELTWTNPADADFTGVLIIRRESVPPDDDPVAGATYTAGQSLGDGVIIYTGAGTSITDSGLSGGRTYHYAVYTYDQVLNYSTAASASARPVDLTAPAAISVLNASSSDHRVDLSWTNPADSDFAGIVVIRRAGQAPSAGPVDGTFYPLNQPLGGGTIIYIGSGTGHTGLNLTNGTTYHYAVYAYDTVRNYSAVASIAATPAAPPTISITGPGSITEGNSGATTATFTVTLSRVSDQIVTVQFATADGSASADSDYLPASGTLSFDPGQTSHQVVISLLGDPEIEPDETFLVRLLSPANATLAITEAAATIADDDQPPPDITPPAPVTGLAISAANGQIGLTGASPADAVGILIVRREWLPPQSSPAGGASYTPGQSLGESLILYAGPAASFSDTSVFPGVTYHYALYAFDAAFNYSAAATTSATLPIPDLTAPFAKLAKPPAVKAGKTPYRFKVGYTDTFAVSALSLGHRNLLITGPRKFKQWAKLVSRSSATDAASILATYQITAPGKTWGSEDNGTYTVWLQPGQVRDASGSAAPKQKLGAFKVAMRSKAAKAARVFASARPVRADVPASAAPAERGALPTSPFNADRLILLDAREVLG